MQPHQRAGILFAAGKGDLEFPAERLGIRMAQHEIGDRLRIGRHVERLFAAHAGDRAAVTLRTELPQASRVVMPTAARRRMMAGVSSMWMK